MSILLPHLVQSHGVLEALRPAEGQLAPEDLRRLKLALGAVMGTEALVALQDVMGLDSDQAVEVCRWMARTLTSATLAASGGRQRPPLRDTLRR